MTPCDWLAHLFGNCDGGWLSFLSIDRTTGEKRTDWQRLDDTTGDLDLPIDTSCVWFGVATRSEQLSGNQRGRAEHCHQIPALWLDIDIVSEVHATDDLPADIDQARALLADYPLAPTAIIDSGHGLQAWWLLDEPLDATQAKTILADWGTTWNVLGHRRGWHIDNVFDIARVMRLPGTWNRKAEPRPVTVLDVDWTRTWGLDQIDEHTLDAPEPPAAQPTRRDIPYIGPERPGDAYNARHTGDELLQRHGWHYDHQTASGDRHYRAPHRPATTETTGATVYGDDGRTVIWSATFARQHGLEIRRPYDPYGLYVQLQHAGDWRTAASELRANGYGSDTWEEITVSAWMPTSVDEPWPDPIPLGTQRTELPPFPIDALPDWIANHAQAVAIELQMPDDLPANLALATLAALNAGRATVNVQGQWNEPLNLYLAVAMPPSAGKSPAFARMTRPVRRHEERLCVAAEETIPFKQQTKRMLEKRMQKAEASGDSDEARMALMELLELGDLTPPRLIADDATPEALTQLLVEQSGRLAIMSTEGGLFDLMTGRYSEKANLDVYLKAWGGDTITVDRIGRGQSRIDHPALTIGLTVQPSVIAALADRPELAGRGLTARFMYAMPVDNVGRRDYLTDRHTDPAIAETYDANMDVIAQQPRPDTFVPQIRIHPDAHHTFKTWKQQLEDQRTPDGDLRPLAEWSVKLESSTIRVAGLLHIADGNPLTALIDTDTMRRAIRIGDYWLAHAFAVHDLWGTDPVLTRARKILDWATGQRRFSIRDLYRTMRRQFPRADDTVQPLTLLVERGWLRPESGEWPPRIGRRGNESPIMQVNPELGGETPHVRHVPSSHGSNDPEMGSHARHVPHVPRDKKEISLTHSENLSENEDPLGHGGHGAHDDQPLQPTGTDNRPNIDIF